MCFFSYLMLAFYIPVIINKHYNVKAITVAFTSHNIFGSYVNQSHYTPLLTSTTSTPSCVQCVMFVNDLEQHFW